MSVFGDLERLAADLYPYRWPIAVAAVVALAGLVSVGYRRGWHGVVRRHGPASAIIAGVALALIVPLGYYTLSPLWTRTTLVEASPLEVAAGGGGPVAEAAPGAAVPRVVRTGEFSGADDLHYGRGTVHLIETAPGAYTLRFEEFSVLNGPDLFVLLSPSAEGYAEGALNLGELKATDGAFNYEVPTGTDISQYRSAIVWCERFTVLFATAPLAAG
jgi:hypothetical protein